MEQARANAKREIPRERERIVGSYRWFSYAPEVTGLRLICLEDLETKTIVTTTVAHPGLRVASQRAWAGARQSRSPGMPWDILSQMSAKGVDADQKLAEMFHSYGHASVGDMARLAVDFGNVPMHLCLALFHEGSINSGQEKSTRYQTAFGKSFLHPLKHYLPTHLSAAAVEQLELDYQALGMLSRDLFAKHRDLLQEAFGHYYQVDQTDRQAMSVCSNRVLDCARSFLLFGQGSGMSYETSARDWSRIIAELKASPLPYYHRVAAQIEHLLAPRREEEEILDYQAEAPGLIRHTSAQMTTNHNLGLLKQFLIDKTNLLQCVPIQRNSPRLVEQRVRLIPCEYSEGERFVAQSLLLLWPGLEIAPLLSWIATRDPETKRVISTLVFANQSNYCELPSYARTTRLTLLIEGCLGELRDFNRHRAWGRFFPLSLIFGEPITKDTADQLLAHGFALPRYLTDIASMAPYKKVMEEDFLLYYEHLQKFIAKVEEIVITPEKCHAEFQNGRAKAGPSFFSAKADNYEQLDDFNINYTFILNLLPLAHRVDLWMHGDPKQALYLTTQRTRPGGHINYRLLASEANQLLAASDPYLSALALDIRPDPASRAEFFDRS